MNIEGLIYYVLIWIVFWWFYNFVLINRGFSTERTPQILTPIFILLSYLLLLLSVGDQHISFHIYLVLFGLVISSLVTRHWILGRVANSIFQMTWLYGVYILTSENLQSTLLIFILLHLPLFLLNHLKRDGAILILVSVSLGGLFIILTQSFIEYPLNIIYMVVLHTAFYQLIRAYDRRYGWGIVN